MNRYAAFVLGLCIVSVVGCGQPEVQPLDEDAKKAVRHYQKVAAAYNRASQANRKPPATANDLKPFLKEFDAGIDPLVSPNDGKPIVIVPGVAMDVRPAADEQSIVAYDQVGANGKRMMVDARGMVHTVTDDEFAKIKFVGGHRPK